ncbi:hypothetical protein [Kineothrix sp. MB12-C1]|uniref:hypothetical protein n=1 Tax=Kineothrix sp. MB12-C1 TaxID=3070215 RepID=UPI0027D297BC|nr:hypothetical protein [Kineothrix sp. MB12-C1]WMC93122.1 hypothetical protein RBB56_02205 [Kineothrix sp. MB12-C1]
MACNDIEVVFKERSSGIEYTEAKDYLELALGKEGESVVSTDRYTVGWSHI